MHTSRFPHFPDYGYEGFDNASPYPTTGLSYRLKIAGAADGRRKFDRLK
ncbi:hypothetical protein HYW11_03410, partial [Candidatus Peregrinibacteria bacterium]|nr:hypothetical protein [Candidatus Peregrinibacteria bacterium]